VEEIKLANASQTITDMCQGLNPYVLELGGDDEKKNSIKKARRKEEKKIATGGECVTVRGKFPALHAPASRNPSIGARDSLNGE
jgi:hypothetical protein